MKKDMVDFDLLKQTFEILDRTSGEIHADNDEKKARIYDLLKDRFDRNHCDRAFNILHAQYRILPDRSPAALKARIKILFNDEVSDEEASRLLNIAVFNRDELSQDTDFLADMHKANMGLGEDSTNKNEVEHAAGKFGFDPGNPIPVNGIDMIDSYFRKLRLITGESVTAKRQGSVQAEHLPYPVDKYAIFTTEDTQVATIYVYAYHGGMSDKAPEGFKLLNN